MTVGTTPRPIHLSSVFTLTCSSFAVSVFDIADEIELEDAATDTIARVRARWSLPQTIALMG